MPATSASTPTPCWSPSPTPASRPWRSRTCWYAPAPSTSSWSTRWPPWSPAPRSRVGWGTPTRASRPACSPSGALPKSRPTAVFINQLREKIGVLFGCLHYDSKVTLADGTQEKIGKIVNQRLPVEVLSYDPESGAVVPRKVVNWFDNGPTDEFLQFTVARPGGNGRSSFACTPNHKIRTPGGWREAQELAVGDRVMEALPHRLSSFQWEALLGGLMGDSALSPTRRDFCARH